MSVIGIDLGGTNVRAGISSGNILDKVLSRRIHNNGSIDEVLDDIFCLVDDLKNSDTEGIGIGVPSVVDVESGVVFDVQNIPSWKTVPLRSLMEKRYNIPVYINNDANCFATGEKYFGKAKGFNNFVGLIVGTGLGAGVILNGRLYSGTNCGAGEFGMIPYKDSIFESYCCGQFFKNKYEISGEEVSKLASEGDERALAIFNEFGEHLGNAIKTILYAVDPEAIILGGSVSKAFKFYKDSMWKSIESFAYSNSLKRLIIDVSELEQVAILGAAALFYDATKN
ncbi:MAG: ROK family protein [Bacteroidota bacterium]|nr:ROK family protein [Bacteroidota bacterium]MDP4191706.1 ROK family protein [Bacteroidota bacterium]